MGFRAFGFSAGPCMQAKRLSDVEGSLPPSALLSRQRPASGARGFRAQYTIAIMRNPKEY